MTDLNVPVDDLHMQCVAARLHVNEIADVLKNKASVWRPRPCPPKEAHS